jgi:hypothetical protein
MFQGVEVGVHLIQFHLQEVVKHCLVIRRTLYIFVMRWRRSR